MSNLWQNPKLLAKKGLARLTNELTISPKVDRTREVDFNMAKHGATLPIKTPVKFEAKAGRQLVIQNVSKGLDTIVIDKEFHVAWAIEAYEKSLNEDAIMGDYIQPAMEILGAEIELSIGEKVANTAYMNVGTPATTPANYAALSAVDLRMTQNAISFARRHLVLDPKAHNVVSNAERTLNLPTRVESQLKSSMVNPVANFRDIVASNHVARHTAGGFDANYVTKGAGQTGATLDIDTGTGTILEGDKFTIAGVNAVDPETKKDLGFLQEFVCTADSAGGDVIINISPSIIPTGAYQNVSAAPADGVAVLFKATHVNNFGFQEDGISLVMIPEPPSDQVKNAFAVNWKGLRFLVTYGHDMEYNKDICRIDALWGVYVDPRKVVTLFG
jgi:hypothetical protein